MAFFEFPHTRTYDSDLGWLIGAVKKLMECCEEIQSFKDEFTEAYNELVEIYNQISAGVLPENIQKAFNQWMKEHAVDLVGELVKMVFFGLTDSGYFVAYIPESWDDIIFNTTEYDIIIPEFGEYGHLTLSY